MIYTEQIAAFVPQTEQEASDKAIILNQIDRIGDDILLRKNKLAHMTSSGFILNEAMTKTLMVHHNIYKTWAWTGGHADG
ncbi:MAG TPA: NUDIX hydrolase, partial [Thermotogota bacterium]|nr:NUDIX hydrolase [Thermotogota bacterium]